MSRTFTLPDLGEGLTEADIVKVLVAVGNVVAEDAPLLEVETDKATVEIPSPMSGRIEQIHVHAGQTVKVGAPLITFAEASAAGGKQVADTLDPTRRLAPPSEPAREGPVPATPSTRRLARELGVDLHTVKGRGPGGRVTDDDVRAAASGVRSTSPARGARAAPDDAGTARDDAGAARVDAGTARDDAGTAKPLASATTAPPLPDFTQWGAVERRPLSHLRRTIAERMALSASLIPHVTHFDKADITDLDALLRANLEAAKAQGVTLTLTAFVLKAVALALREHPEFNASLDPATGELVIKRYVHLGVAVATDRGLIVPVLRDVDTRGVLDLARALGPLAQRVRDGKVTLEELRGGTFTVTNIGALGGTGAIPIINYPEVAILGLARARQEPAVHDGAIVSRMLLPLSLTFDHRVADGADGARFATDIVRRLERPDRLLLGL